MTFTRELLFDAILKSIENASQLTEEAMILREHSKLARAYTLYQLSIEEIGKASLVLAFLFENEINNSTKQEYFLKEFRDHKKTKQAMGFDLAVIAPSIKNPMERKQFTMGLIEQYEQVNKINDLKNHRLYTSIINEQFVLPKEIITSELIDKISLNAN